MEAFPAFFPLAGKRVVIAGEGAAAEAKVRLFQGSPAELVRLTDERALDPAAYEGAALAFVASADEAFRKGAARAARVAHTPLNVVDHPALSDFHTPAVIDRGQVVAAVGTAGAAPLLASLIRSEVEAHVPPGAGRLAALLARHQEAVRAAFPDLAERRAFLRGALAGPAAEAALAGRMEAASRLLLDALAGGGPALNGRVSIIAGADGDLVSLRALRALAAADAVAAAPGAEPFLAAHARRDADRLEAVDVATLSSLTGKGRHVVLAAPKVDMGLVTDLRRAEVRVEIFAPAPEDGTA